MAQQFKDLTVTDMVQVTAVAWVQSVAQELLDAEGVTKKKKGKKKENQENPVHNIFCFLWPHPCCMEVPQAKN